MDDMSQQEGPTFYNKRGVIAEQYAQLQAVHILEKAREAYPLPQASHVSTIRAVFQAAEIALLNLNDLMKRAIDDAYAGRFGPLAIKLSWARSFHAVMVSISSIPQKLALVPEDLEGGRELSILDSPAFKMYLDTLKVFDEQILSSINEGEFPLADLIGQQSLDDNKMHFLHLIRLCNHEATIWERNLSSVFVSAVVPCYEEFVVTQSMYQAVYDTMLEGDTYYTQFRGLHQIPEILTAEINDHIEMAIVNMRAKDLRRAYEHLRCLNILAEGVLAAQPPIADNLATADYHNIRENLGLTSGSHSVNIHYHLFRDLYDQLWSAFVRFLVDEYAGPQTHKEVQELLREVDLMRFENEQSFMLSLLANELLQMRAFINEWRELHLHFPRNNIGGDHTKSLTGASDAVQAVKKMRDAALIRDPFHPLTHVRKLDNVLASSKHLPLTSYFNAEHSLDQKLLETTGNITKQRFKDVQKRVGVFARKGPFVPPPRREV
jgi:tryptophan 2,3-dioxygenase